MSGKRTRAAVVLFVDSPNVTEPDDITHIVKRELHRRGMMVTDIEVPWNLPRDSPVVRIVDVIDAGVAAGNGYLWTEVTSKAFRIAPPDPNEGSL